MSNDFFDVCERLDPDIDALNNKVAQDCVAKVLGNEEISKVFILALKGLVKDQPTTEVLEKRIHILVDHFI